MAPWTLKLQQKTYGHLVFLESSALLSHPLGQSVPFSMPQGTQPTLPDRTEGGWSPRWCGHPQLKGSLEAVSRESGADTQPGVKTLRPVQLPRAPGHCLRAQGSEALRLPLGYSALAGGSRQATSRAILRNSQAGVQQDSPWGLTATLSSVTCVSSGRERHRPAQRTAERG